MPYIASHPEEEDVRAQERREEDEEPAGESGAKQYDEGRWFGYESLIKWSTPSSEDFWGFKKSN